MSRELTMGSLFDGIGGFPLAAVRNGVTPVWASEIETFPIEVTQQRSTLATSPSCMEQICRRWISSAAAVLARISPLPPEREQVLQALAPAFLWNKQDL